MPLLGRASKLHSVGELPDFAKLSHPWILGAAELYIREVTAQYNRNIPMTRLLLPLLLLAPLPAVAQWSYDPAQSAATAYCAAKASGQSHRQAENAARYAVVNATSGGFSNQLGAVLFGGSQAMQNAGYLAQRMCPDLYGDKPVTQVRPPKEPVTPEEKARFCDDNPWLKQCGGAG